MISQSFAARSLGGAERTSNRRDAGLVIVCRIKLHAARVFETAVSPDVSINPPARIVGMSSRSAVWRLKLLAGRTPADMAQPLAMNLRERVLACIWSGVSGRQAGRVIGVRAARVSHWRTRGREQGDAQPRARALLASLTGLMTQPSFERGPLARTTHHAGPCWWSSSTNIPAWASRVSGRDKRRMPQQQREARSGAPAARG